jgi:RNA recognition motif-containing protein
MAGKPFAALRERPAADALWRQRKSEDMENKLYVGNLPYSATEAELTTLFSKAGAVKSVTMITDRETGRSKGFGFVEMENEADAQKAISMLNGTQLGNRSLTVNVARPREERGGGGGGFGGRRPGGQGGRPGNRGPRW